MIVSKRSLDALQSKYDILKLNCALLEKILSDSRANESLLEKERDLWKGIGEQSATLDVMMSRIISIYEATCTIRTGGPKKKRSIGDERKSKKKKSK